MHVNLNPFLNFTSANIIKLTYSRCLSQYTGSRCESLFFSTVQPTTLNQTNQYITYTFTPVINSTNTLQIIQTNQTVTTYSPLTNSSNNLSTVSTSLSVMSTISNITSATNSAHSSIPTNSPHFSCSIFSCWNGGTLTITNGQCSCK